MTSKSLHKTNPRLSSNIKVVLDSNDELFLEMIPSSPYLSLSMFKGYEYNESLNWGTNLRNFVSPLSNIDELYGVYDETELDINDNLSTQYQRLYHWGCYSDSSKFVNDNMRFFAPLHIKPGELAPDMFIVLKIDAKEYTDLLFENKLSTWIRKGEIVHTQDLSKIKKLCFDQVESSYVNMQFGESGELNDVLQTYGLNAKTGMYKLVEDTSILDFLNNEVSITEFENWVTNGYKRETLIYSNIINLEFAFTDTPTNQFERYVGLYVNRNSVSLADAQAYIESGVLAIAQHEDRVEKVSTTTEIESYEKVGLSQFANSFGTKRKPILEFDFVINPARGSLMQIMYEGTAQHTIIFDSTIINRDINVTKQNIVNSINLTYAGTGSTVSAEIRSNGFIRLTSNSALAKFEGLSLVAPSFFTIKKPKNIVGSYQNTFIGGGTNTVSINTYINIEEFNKIQYYDDQGTKWVSAVTRVYEYDGDYLYELTDPIPSTKTNKPSNCWFVKDVQSEISICSLLPHASIDFDHETSVYNDILDFDIDKYEAYLLKQIDKPTFTGDVLTYYAESDLSNLTDQQIADYKDILRGSIGSFFDSIVLTREYLFKNINLLTSEASTTTNEYLRLEETTNEILTSKNILYQYISKWALSTGNDVYMNPYRLNMSLAFRNESFAPSQELVDRNIGYHTHSWFILADGTNPYLELNTDTAHKLLSYSKLPITATQLTDTSFDAYSLLEYQTTTNIYQGWSLLSYDSVQNACYTFFRGVLYRFETNDLDGYRFSVMLKGSESVIDDVYKMNMYRNDTFKTITLFINFYIPDPILTSLERGTSNYYLDRSLLYFSNEIYSTAIESIDFGTDNISLALYDRTSQKKYLGQVVTTDWYYQSSLGPILYVGRGDSSIFNVSLNDIIAIGDNFEIYYTSSDDDTSPFYGMYITFEEIVEVTRTHFWCKRIKLKTVLTSDPDGIDDDDIADNTVDSVVEYANVYDDFVADPNIFNSDNTVYISRAIAYENSIYDKIISSSVNNARYKEISLSNIKNFMSSNPVVVNGTDSIKGSILSPNDAQILVRLYSENSELKQLVNPYAFPIKRYNGKYDIRLQTLARHRGTTEYPRIFADDVEYPYEYKLNISKNVRSTDYRIERFKDFIPTVDDAEFYSYVSAITGSEIANRKLPWVSNPKEHRGFASIVFNSSASISISGITAGIDGTIDLFAVLKSDALGWISNSLVDSISAEAKLYIRKLYQDTVEETVDNYDYRNLIAESFIINTFLSIYYVETIVDTSGRIVQFNMDTNTITLIETFDTSTLTITFNR